MPCVVDEETRQTILSGRGLVHIEITAEKIQRKFNVGMDIATPKVAYRETFKKKVRVQGKHKKTVPVAMVSTVTAGLNLSPYPRGPAMSSWIKLWAA